MELLVRDRKLSNYVPMSAMQVGDIAYMPERDEYVLRTWNNFVSLSDPRNTWANPAVYNVEILSPKEWQLVLERKCK